MLVDTCIYQLVDFENTNDYFPGADFAGGVCYFLSSAKPELT